MWESMSPGSKVHPLFEMIGVLELVVFVDSPEPNLVMLPPSTSTYPFSMNSSPVETRTSVSTNKLFMPDMLYKNAQYQLIGSI